MYFVLTVISSKSENKMYFLSLNDAYRYYLRNFATLEDWLIGLIVEHKLLCAVKDERTMWDMFDNVFDNQKVSLKVFTKLLDKCGNS